LKRHQEELSGIQIVDKRYGWANRAKSLAVAENMLTAHDDLDRHVRLERIERRGRGAGHQRPQIQSEAGRFRLEPGLLDDVQSGLIDSLVAQDPFKMGHDAVIAA